MLTSPIKNEIKYNFIDYKKPVNLVQNDFRTSTYLGHRYYKDNDGTIPGRHSIISPCYALQQKEIRYDYATEQSSKFSPKLNFNRTNKANLCMSCTKPQFVKAMQQRIFSSPPKPMRYSAVYPKDYVFRPLQDQNYVILNQMSRPSQLPEYADVDTECEYNYATTNMTVYRPPKDVHVPGCSKDTVTVWNYIQKPKLMALDLPKYKLVPKRPIILQHNGMKSENQDAYTVPVPKKFRCDVKWQQ